MKTVENYTGDDYIESRGRREFLKNSLLVGGAANIHPDVYRFFEGLSREYKRSEGSLEKIETTYEYVKGKPVKSRWLLPAMTEDHTISYGIEILSIKVNENGKEYTLKLAVEGPTGLKEVLREGPVSINFKYLPETELPVETKVKVSAFKSFTRHKGKIDLTDEEVDGVILKKNWYKISKSKL